MLKYRGFRIGAVAVWAIVSVSPTLASVTGRAYREFNTAVGFDAEDVAISGLNVYAISASGARVGPAVTAADGTYTLATADGRHQIVFELPDYLKSNPGSTTASTEIQFVSDPAGAGNGAADFVVTYPLQICAAPTDGDFVNSTEGNINLVFTAFGQGATASAIPNRGTVRVIPFDVPNSAVAGGGAATIAGDVDATQSNTGSVYGLAFHRFSNRILAGAYLRRHSELGPSLAPGGYTNTITDPSGQIYLINRTAGAATTVSLFADINDINGNTSATGTNPRTATNWEFFYDSPTAASGLTVPQRSTAAQDLYRAVGHTGLGDMELSEDGRILYVIALRDRRLYQLDASVLYTNPNPAPRTSFANPPLAIPTSACANSADAQPFGLGLKDGQVYIGVTCTAESTTSNAGNTRGDLTQLRAAVYRFDPATQSFSAALLNFPLNYPRGCTSGSAVNQTNTYTGPANCGGSDNRAFWQPWNNNWMVVYDDPSLAGNVGNLSQNDFYIEHPQPLLVDIDFDREGFMFLGFRDINADRVGACAAGPDVSEANPGNCADIAGDQVVTRGYGGGDLLCASPNGTGFTLEANGACGSRASNNAPNGSSANGQGPGGTGGDFFWNDQAPGGPASMPAGTRDPDGLSGHGETLMGSMAVVPYAPFTGRTVMRIGQTDLTNQTINRWIVGGIIDPSEYYDGGMVWIDPLNGQSHKRTKLIDTVPANNALPVDTGKSSGLGDIELLCTATPSTTIGNRVWLDEPATAAADGQQGVDTVETGVDAVTITLFDSAGTQRGQVTTAGGGFYNFVFTVGASDANTGDGNVILPNPHFQTYYLVVDETELAAGGTLAGRRLALSNQTTGNPGYDDYRDSDAAATTVPSVGARSAVITLTLGAPGDNDFSFDFGFRSADYGDLPDGGGGTGSGNYQTRLADGGPVNLLNNALRLGATAGVNTDGDNGTLQDVAASQDNSDGSNDEDGITIPALLPAVAPTFVASVFNNTGATQNVCGYVDFNDDGDFLDAGESVTSTVGSSASAQNVNLVFSGSVGVAQTFTNNFLYARFRAQSAACSPIGDGGLGEVEDYAIPVSDLAIAVSPAAAYCPGQSTTFTITVSNTGPRTAGAVVLTSDLMGSDEAVYAGIPRFADANWAVTASSGGASSSLAVGNGIDIGNGGPLLTLPSGSSITFTVQGTVPNNATGSQTYSADIAAPGALDRTAANNLGSDSTAASGSCTPDFGRGALCPVTTGLAALTVSSASTVVNTYYPAVASTAAGSRCVRVGTPRGASVTPDIAPGNLLLVMQMQGGTLASTADNSSYGDGAPNSPGGAGSATAGTFEYAIAQSAVQAVGVFPCAGLLGVVEVASAATGGGLINAYTQDTSGTEQDRFQLIRVPVHSSVSFTGAADQIDATPWDGSSGGVIALDATGDVNLGATPGAVRFNADATGFQGGSCAVQTTNSAAPVFAAATTASVGLKGEGYAGSPSTGYSGGNFGLGAPGSGGGSGQKCTNGQYTGAGGGGNGGAGGAGGADTCTAVGHGGGILPGGTSSVLRPTLGGAGGAGATEVASAECAGGTGGGIIMIRAGSFSGQGSIEADGAAAADVAANDRGGGGGGAGGTITLMNNLASSTTYTNITVQANGGAGGNNTSGSGTLGGGGGGGAGRIYVTQTAGTLAGTRNANGGTGLDNGANGTPFTPVTALDPVNSSPGVRPAFVCDGASTVPVTLAAVSAQFAGGQLEVNFDAASEAGTLGYHVYVDGIGIRQKLNAELVLAKNNGSERQRYTVRGAVAGGESVTLEEVDQYGQSTFYGPYKIGTRTGDANFTTETDWNAVRAEQHAFRLGQLNLLRSQRGSSVTAEIGVERDGWVRLTHADLLAAGIDFSGVAVSELRLRRGAASEPVQITGPEIFGPDSVVEFLGRAASGSLYGDRQLYRLVVGGGDKIRLDRVYAGAGTLSDRNQYRATIRMAPNALYSFSAPNGDPWYAARAVRQAASSTPARLNLSVSGLQAGAEARLHVDVWGGLDFSGESPDHAVQLRFNGVVVATDSFDGIVARRLTAELPAGLLREGNNTVELELLGSTGFSTDVVNLEAVEVSFPRALMLDATGQLRFQPEVTGAGLDGVDRLWADNFEDAGQAACDPQVDRGCAAYRVTGLVPTAEVRVLRQRGESIVELSGRRSVDGTTVRFAVSSLAGDVIHVQQQPTAVASLAPALPVSATLLSGSASYLIISHPSFVEHLGPLVSARQAEGLSVKVTNVEDIYRAYGTGVVDPLAIRAYVREAARRLGTRYVLIVGGDTYDYRNVLGFNSVSFVPTPYTATSAIVRFAPADGMLADLNGDRRADLPIGRLPVRTVAELQNGIQRILTYPASGHLGKALFVSDRNQLGFRYSEESQTLADALGPNWNSTPLNLDSYAAGATASARADLVNAINAGLAIVSWYGHSSPSTWGREALLTAPQVYGGLLQNATQPTNVLQWGCWGAYFVDPRYNTLAHGFLLHPTGGAATYLGATGLTETSSDTAIARRLLPLMTQPGVRVGDALLEVQGQLQAPAFDDVTIGTALLGDPALKVRP